MMDDDHLKYKPNKLCGICGDKALGYNFNAITCEACKAFFRRNALRTKEFKCPFDGNCKIDLVTRRFCQKCRLKKCFDIGMKKEWILSEDEKRIKRDKILENRRKKELSLSSTTSPITTTGSEIHATMIDGGDINIDTISRTSHDNSNHSDNNSLSNHSFMNDTAMNMNANKHLLNISTSNGHYNYNDNNAIASSYHSLTAQRGFNFEFFENNNNYNTNNHSVINNNNNGLNNQKENFFNSIYMLEHQKYQQNLYLSSKLFSMTPKTENNNNNDIYSTQTSLVNNDNIKSSNDHVYNSQNHFSHSSAISSYNNHYHHQLQPHSQYLPQSHRSYEKSLNLATTITMPQNKQLPSSQFKNNNIQRSLPSSNLSSVCNSYNNDNGCKLNKNNSNDHRIKIKTECNETLFSDNKDHHATNRSNLSLKSEPEDCIIMNVNKNVLTSPSSKIDDYVHQYKQKLCHTNEKLSISSSDKNESVDTAFFNNNNNNDNDSSDVENFKEIHEYESRMVKKFDTKEAQNTYQSQTSPANDVNSFKNVSCTSPEGKKNGGENAPAMMSGQSITNNVISILQYNLNAIGPESLSESYNYIETYRLEELFDACEQLHQWYHYGSILYEMRHLKEIYRVAEHVCRHLISMAKMITAFTDLCETDQISLLKYSVTEILILRSVSCYLPDKDAWIFNIDNSGKGTLLQFSTCMNQIPNAVFNEEIKHFLMSVPENCRNDRNLFDLATMVILFNPNCSELKHKDVVRLEHITYCHLLCKYIHINYSSTSKIEKVTTTMTGTATATPNEDKNKCIELNTILNLIDLLHKINKKINDFFLLRLINDEYNIKNHMHPQQQQQHRHYHHHQEQRQQQKA